MSDMEKQDAVLMEFRWRPFKVLEMAAEIARLRDENAALRSAIERVRAACENELRWVDAQPILRALEVERE